MVGLSYQCSHTPIHTALFVQWFVAKNKMSAVPHPPYSLDLPSCNFLFPKIKLKLRKRFNDVLKDSENYAERTSWYYK
jgi:hypothetical protein